MPTGDEPGFDMSTPGSVGPTAGLLSMLSFAMGSIHHTPLGGGRTEITHAATGAVITTDVSPEFGGGGSTFSSTDLVAAGLGSCISSSLAPLAERHGVPLTAVTISVEKELGTDPKRISRLATTITFTQAIDDSLAKRFRRAAETCTVHRSLHPDIDAPIELRFPPST